MNRPDRMLYVSDFREMPRGSKYVRDKGYWLVPIEQVPEELSGLGRREKDQATGTWYVAVYNTTTSSSSSPVEASSSGEKDSTILYSSDFKEQPRGIKWEKDKDTFLVPISEVPNSLLSKGERVYDASSKTWYVRVYPDSYKPAKDSTTPSSTATGNDSTSKVDSKTQAEKKYIETEFNTLTGDMALTPSKSTIKIKVNDTITLSGVGSYLSGQYFVSAVKRSISASGGYSQTITVMKNGFGDSLKQAKSSKTTNSSGTSTNRSETVEKSASNFKVGDSVKIVGDNAVYSNASDGVKVPAWVKEKTLTVKQISSDGNRVLLMPIFSWTYVKFVQKV